MAIITEEMRFRKRLCDFALKNGVTKAARRYQTNRQFVYRQLDKYDGTVKSLALKSRRPHTHPNSHTEEELSLVRKTLSSYGNEGRAEVYIQLKRRGYKRSYGSMCKIIRQMKTKPKKQSKMSYRKHVEVRGQFAGDKVQVDIKYVPHECIAFDSKGIRYYQITAIDEYSRKRVLKIVDEKTVTNTSIFMKELEKEMGFRIVTIQTDNGNEFVNTQVDGEKETEFERTLKSLGIKHKRTAPYSPWQNGKVERSHREDNERFYSRRTFKTVNDMKKQVSRYNTRYNNVHKKVIGFKSPNQVVSECKLKVVYES